MSLRRTLCVIVAVSVLSFLPYLFVPPSRLWRPKSRSSPSAGSSAGSQPYTPPAAHLPGRSPSDPEGVHTEDKDGGNEDGDYIPNEDESTNETVVERTGRPNHEIAAMLSKAKWVQPIALPEVLPWSANTSHRPACAQPARRPERMYIFNHPMRCLDFFERQTGFLLFKQGTPIPNSINPVPLVYSPGWRMSRRFGRWAAHWEASPAPYPPTRSQVTMAEAELYVMVFQNSWVYRGSVVQCNRYFAPGACTGLQEPINNFEAIPPKEKDGGQPGEQVFVLCDRHCKGYYHWTHEQLPRLGVMYDRLIKDPSIIITAPRNGMIMQYLQLMGFPKTQVRDIYKKATADRYPTVFYKTVYYPQPMRCGSILAPQLFLIRKIIFQRLGLNAARTGPVDPQRMLVVLADRTDRRQPRNAKNISLALRARFPNVEFVSHLGKDVKTQIELFNRADLVIGPHGANLGNIMWSKQGAAVLEYVPVKTGNLCYYQTASKLDLQYRMLVVPLAIDVPNEVSFEEVARHVDDVYKGRTSCRDGERWVACPDLQGAPF
eukprot:EG_transcript_6724